MKQVDFFCQWARRILIVCFAQIELESHIMRLFNKNLLVSKNCCCIYRRKSFVQEKIKGCSGGLVCIGSSWVPWLFLLGSSKTLLLMKRPNPSIRKKLSLHKFGPWHLNIFFFFFNQRGELLYPGKLKLCSETQELIKHFLDKQDDMYSPEAALVTLWLDDDFWVMQVINDLPIITCVLLFCSVPLP